MHRYFKDQTMNGKWLRMLISVLLTSVLINPGIVTRTGAASQDAPRSAVVAAAALSPAESHAVAVPQVASLTVNKTVGTNPSVCAATDSINVGPGTPVTYCYTVQNTGDQNLVTHDLVDDRLGAILNDFPYVLIPDASAFLTSTVTITESVVNTATWTAQASGGGSASDSDTATVTVVLPSLTITKTVGTDPAVCANTDSVTVEPGTLVTYCYTVENTGIQSLVTHDLVDDRLGTLLNNFPYMLVPGATAFITSTAVITSPVVNTATWTAQTSGGDSASDSDTATVNLPSPPSLLVYLPLVLRQ